jgi:putative ATP-dependent endonuclease of OLD family
VILVEGITEALLLPVLARRAGFNLEHGGVSIVPVCGVDFGSICQLYGGNGLHTHLVVVTDGDAGTERCESADNSGWESRIPKRDGAGKLAVCDRVAKLIKDYEANEFVHVFHSDVTLEYSLADAGLKNPSIMCKVWEDQFDGTPRTLNARRLEACGGNHGQEVLAVWRAICLSDATCSKAEFAQALAEALDEKADGNYRIPETDFTIPDYLLKAFNHVIPAPAKAAD